MKFLKIENNSISNGIGFRTVLWLSGCSHHCKGCHNPETWDENNGEEFDENAKNLLFEYLKNENINGITFSGGDPFFEKNREGVKALCREIHEKFPNKTIWVYTGYKFEELPEDLLDDVDILVDGEFEEDKKNLSLAFKGSENQRIIDVQSSLLRKKIILGGDLDNETNIF